MELNIDQRRIVETKPNGHMLVKGVAGSGKTTVVVNKIPYLLNHYCIDEDDNILVITYAKTLINYIEHIYKKMDKSDTLFRFLDNDNVEIKTIDSIIMSLFWQYMKHTRKKYNIIETKDQYNLLEYAIDKISSKYPKQNIVSQENSKFLLDEIDWIKSNMYTELETYQNVDRRGRSSNLDVEGPQRLQKNSLSRRAVFELMVLYDSLMEKRGLIDFKSVALKVLNSIKKGIVIPPKYTHILIDESQDLTRAQLEILGKMYNDTKRYSSIVFVADTAQSIYNHSWLSYQSFKSIGFDMSGRSRVLSKNYRTTTQIAQAAYSLIEKDENITGNENYVKPSVIEREGEYPLYRNFKSVEEELNFICTEIKEKLYKKYNLKDIAIIARNKMQLINAKDYFIKNGIDAEIVSKSEPDFDRDSIKLLTMHSVKGLEFNVVMIIGLDYNVIPLINGDINDDYMESVERKLLYVGMTRAKEELYLTSSSKPSKFIDDIDPRFLRSGDIQCFTKLRHIGVENYKYRDKITDLYSYEEVVRQWVINELHERLNYPFEMMDIEYHVKLFSKSGYVDIVVFNCFNHRKVPYIFIEVKRPDEDLKGALKQLKSYMGVEKDVEYGMVTNGKETIIVKKKENSMVYTKKLPFFENNINNLTEEFEYIDLRRRQSYRLVRNIEDNNTLNVFSGNGDFASRIEEYHKLKVYGNIAAGNFKLAVEDVIDEFILPREFMYDCENCFLLKVDGDSMINAGINKGDYVVVHKQNYADNLDIIVAVVENEATLKKFTRMGSNIFLVPENKKYEPIMVKEDELIINGKVIGVLKRK